jgi:hypothetical protein
LLFDLFIAQEDIRIATPISRDAGGEFPDSALRAEVEIAPRFGSAGFGLRGQLGVSWRQLCVIFLSSLGKPQ